jgi:hypothetical protein
MTCLILDLSSLPSSPDEAAQLIDKIAAGLAKRTGCFTALLLHEAKDRELLRGSLPRLPGNLALLEVTPETPIEEFAHRVGAPTEVAHIFCAADFSEELLHEQPGGGTGRSLAFLLPPLPVEKELSLPLNFKSVGWRAGCDLAACIMAQAKTVADLRLPRFLGEMHRWEPMAAWTSAPLRVAPSFPTRRSDREPLLHSGSKILAIVPHHRCEEWLPHVLATLQGQTRPPDQIVVIDDNSGEPPRNIVARFPDVSLLSTPRNIGPEAIVHQVMEQTEFDGYMLHDADDWSSLDRLELSLQAAEQTGAGLVAAQELQYVVEESGFRATTFPFDISGAMRTSIGHFTINGANVISRQLARVVGGMDASYRLCADTDFVYRAALGGLAINLPRFAYLRRIRGGSLTTDTKTRHGSLQRTMEQIVAGERAKKNQQRLRDNQPLQLRPVRTAAPLAFIHERGPRLPAAKCGLTPP